MGEPPDDGRDPGAEPVWLVRIAILLFFAAFAVFLAREVRDVVQAL